MSERYDEMCWLEEEWEDGEEYDDSSYFAYQGFGLVCLEARCEHWGGDSLCGLVLAWMAYEAEGGEEPEGVCPLCW